LDDQFPAHPKVLRAGVDAAWLYVCSICYCAKYLTDGFVPKEAVATLSSLRQPGRHAARLVDVGLWRDREDQYEVHDYLRYNPSREQVEAEREAAKRRRNVGQKRGRASPDVRANVFDPVPVPESPADSLGPRGGRDVVFEAVCESVGWPVGELTKDARGRVNAATKQLRDLGASPAEIRTRADRYRVKHPGMPVTPQAITGNWAALAVEPNGVGGHDPDALTRGR
jgi:hypothetical protein